MNKRIKELATEARLLTGWPVGEVEYQKFAELIIQECCSAIRLNDVFFGGKFQGAILKHFGVEE
jgi:hypothetical protein